TRSKRDWSSDVCSSDLPIHPVERAHERHIHLGSVGCGSHRELQREIVGVVELHRRGCRVGDTWQNEIGPRGIAGNEVGGRVAARSEERRVGKEGRWAWW